jgi:hypothetical protein
MKRLILALPAIALAGCVIPIGGAEVGDLRVTWSFDGSQVCEKVGVDNVTIQLIEKGQEGKDGAKAFGQTAECIAGSMIIENVVAGTYVMTAVGTGEVAVFDNGEGVTLEVVPNTLSEASAPLALANGEVVSRIEFQYNFAGEALCSAADVATINAQVIDDNGVAIAGSNTDCIAGLAVVEGIRVGDPTLKVEGADGDGNVRFVAEKALLGLQPGETLRLDPLTLTPALVDVAVAFTFDDQSCGEAGVDNVDVQLLDDVGVVAAAQNVQCIDGRATFTDMPVGAYTVRIDALDGNDEVLFSAEDVALVLDGVDDDDTDALAGDDISVELVARLATVTIPFVFPAAQASDTPQSCAEVGVQNVDIQIIDADGNVTGTNVACIAGDSGPLTVAPGRATIRIDAIAGDDVTFAFNGERTVETGDNVLAAIPLETRRSTFVASWDFTIVRHNINGGGDVEPAPTTSCVEADVDTVIVRVFRAGVLEIATTVDCDEGRVEIPGLAVGQVRLEIEGIREQEGDTPFSFKQQNFVIEEAARTEAEFHLLPARAFALIIWTGDCGNVGATTVDLQIDANGIPAGINLPCAQGSATLALPVNAESSAVSIALRGVQGQGEPVGAAPEVITSGLPGTPTAVVPGLNVFRFAGPAI